MDLSIIFQNVQAHDGFPIESVMDRFWRYVDKKAPDECWEWLKGKTTCGYGKSIIRNEIIGSHRISWMAYNNREIPNGMCICHHCDNPPCVNPAHLFLGSSKDNVQDMLRKGRGQDTVGQNNPQAKLNETQVRLIRYWWSLGNMKCVRMARYFGVDPQTIYNVINRYTWSHVEN